VRSGSGTSHKANCSGIGAPGLCRGSGLLMDASC